MASIRVHTTQNVTLEYQVASIGDRIVATLIDSLVQIAYVAVWVGIFYWIGASSGRAARHSDWHWGDAGTIGAALVLFLIAAPYLFYNLLCEIFLNGQSIGKKARHLRVVRLDGTAPRVGDYFLRWLLRFVDMFFYGAVAMITIAANGRGQRLGDLAAGTSVINLRAQPAPVPSAASLAPPAGYQPVFPQAANLADHDAALLHRLLARPLTPATATLLHEAALKTKDLLRIHTDLDDAAFLHTVLRDHAHLTHEAAAR
ncbi:RDD family protein [Hymenobacter sp. RP-2-7]|uniref:RDD family protein n=1 Tax=Hymenobacter polaris TaxID=2682546 RepID=A0A7Y0AI83_9BACT|nr:RDD family protein [Hymenobacter polaris]NML67764.1 RDD family protein [Hymenobacter polaris]